MIFTSKEAKAAVSGLRRELKALSNPVSELSHTGVQQLLARALNHKNWDAFRATFADSDTAEAKNAAASAPPVKPVAPRYPLVNNGEFDFVAKGQPGRPFDNFLQPLEGTSERVYGTADVSSATREADGNLDVEYAGETDIDWNTQETLSRNGLELWLTSHWDECTERQVVLLPEGYEGDDPEGDEDLPVRQALVDAFFEYYEEHPSAKRNEAEQLLGFALSEVEVEELEKRLGHEI